MRGAMGPGHSRRVPLGVAVRALATALVLACAGGSPNTISPGHEGAPGVESVLLLPMNFGFNLPPELEEPAERVEAEIEGFLRARRRSVEDMPFGIAQKEWSAALADAKARGSTASAEDKVSLFLERLRRRSDFDAMILPNLVTRRVRVARMFAKWDGVSRRLPTHNEPRLEAGQSGGFVADGFSGEFMAASLRLVIYSREGSRVFEGRGGLDFLEFADLTDVMETRRWRVGVREDLLEDRAILRNGVRLAFDPYL